MAAVEQTGVIPISDARRPEPAGLALLRQPFPAHQVSKLPKGTKAQNDCPANEKKNCTICGGWHHPKIIHLDYVGHAAITDRLLDADPHWSWAPMALDDNGLPRFDTSGGLWIKLTVCGVTRLGYGHAASKSHMDPGAREKEVIGDALRNACMRFGAALELWHKGDLHLEGVDDEPEPQRRSEPPPTAEPAKQGAADILATELLSRFGTCASEEQIEAVNAEMKAHWEKIKNVPGIASQLQKARARARQNLRNEV